MLITFSPTPVLEFILLFELFLYIKTRSREIEYERINLMQEIDKSNLITYNAILKLKNISSDIEFNKLRKLFTILNITYKEYFESIDPEIIYRNPSIANSTILSDKIHAFFNQKFGIYNLYKKRYMKKNMYLFDDFRIGIAEYDDSCFSESDFIDRINHFTRCENMDLYFSSINHNTRPDKWDIYFSKKLDFLHLKSSTTSRSNLNTFINKSDNNLANIQDGYIKFKRFYFNKSKGTFDDITDKLLSYGLFRERSDFENLFNHASKLETYNSEHKLVQWEGYVYQITYMFQLMIHKELISKEKKIHNKISNSFLNGKKQISSEAQSKEYTKIKLSFLDSNMKPCKTLPEDTYLGLKQIWDIFEGLNL